jgi:hypothetical protein
MITLSNGTKWCIALLGNDLSNMLAEDKVAVVTRNLDSGYLAEIELTKVIAIIDSPTLAAWSQISGPSGLFFKKNPSRSCRECQLSFFLRIRIKNSKIYKGKKTMFNAL